MSDVTNMFDWKRRQEAAQAAAPSEVEPCVKVKLSIVMGRVQMHITGVPEEQKWSLPPETARALASMLLCHATAAEAAAGLPARRFLLTRRRAGYEVWLCQGADRTMLLVPGPLRRREQARTWAMVYAALHGWPYLEDA